MAVLHRWLGVIVCAFVVLSSVSGLLLLWADDYRRWRYPMLPETIDTLAPDAGILARIASTTGAGATTIALPTAELPAYRVYFGNGREALFHPHTGDRFAEWGWGDSLPAFLFEAHVNLFAGSIGHTLVGALGGLLVAMIGSGLWLWWRSRRAYGLRHVLPSGADSRELKRSHAVQGAWLAPLMLVIVVSGVALVFPAPVQGVLNAALGARGPASPAPMSLGDRAANVHWPAAIESARRAFPGARLRFVTPPQRRGEPLLLRLRQPGELHPNGRSYLQLDPRSGRILARIDALERGAGPLVFNSLYPLHAGKTGWTGYRAVLAVLCLGLAYLAVSGVVLFARRQRASVRCRRSVTRHEPHR